MTACVGRARATDGSVRARTDRDRVDAGARGTRRRRSHRAGEAHAAQRGDSVGASLTSRDAAARSSAQAQVAGRLLLRAITRSRCAHVLCADRADCVCLTTGADAGAICVTTRCSFELASRRSYGAISNMRHELCLQRFQQVSAGISCGIHAMHSAKDVLLRIHLDRSRLVSCGTNEANCDFVSCCASDSSALAASSEVCGGRPEETPPAA